MKKFFLFTVFLLVFSTPVFCSHISRLYQKHDYYGVLEALERKEDFTKLDYITYAKTMYELGTTDQWQSCLLMYFLLCNESDYGTEDRQFAVNRFLESHFPDGLTIICLVPSDGHEACLALYNAYTSLKQTKQAEYIKTGYLE